MKHHPLSTTLRRFAVIAIVASLCLVPGTRRTHAQPALFDLGTLGGSSSVSQGINAMGQVVGHSTLDPSGIQHAFLWTPDVPNGTTGGMRDLGYLAPGYSFAYGINDLGVVVGTSHSSSDSFHAFVWIPVQANAVDGTMFDLGTMGGSESEARDVNNIGQIVGWSQLANADTFALETHAFLRMPNGAMVDI